MQKSQSNKVQLRVVGYFVIIKINISPSREEKSTHIGMAVSACQHQSRITLQLYPHCEDFQLDKQHATFNRLSVHDMLRTQQHCHICLVGAIAEQMQNKVWFCMLHLVQGSMHCNVKLRYAGCKSYHQWVPEPCTLTTQSLVCKIKSL